MVDLISDDPNEPAYYFPILVTLALVLMILHFIIYYIKDIDPRDQLIKKGLSVDIEGSNLSANLYISGQKNSLKFRYLCGYVLTRASIWSKAPYLYTLYSTYHKFSLEEIGVLYMIDAICALIGGPITGNLADVFGRRTFCQIYNLFVITNLSLRLTGIRGLAYIAQMLTGLGNNLINTTFESWLIYEAGKIFEDRLYEKDIYLKSIFKEQTLIDAMMSLIVASISAILYTVYGIFAPIILSMSFCLLGILAMALLWDENRPGATITDPEADTDEVDGLGTNANHTVEQQAVQQVGRFHNLWEALAELKKREVISVALMESLFQGALNIYLFAWTPILQSSTDGPINVGFIFINYVTFIIIGTKVFEIVSIHLNADIFATVTCGYLIEMFNFQAIYMFKDFRLRVVLLSLEQGLTGFFNPSFSTIKSRIIHEKHRALLMSIFRIPLNTYVLCTLGSLKYLAPLDICLIISSMTCGAFLIALSLFIWKPPEKSVKKPRKASIDSNYKGSFRDVNLFKARSEVVENNETRAPSEDKSKKFQFSKKLF